MKIRRGFISNAVIKKSIYAIVICFALHSCSTTIDKNNFNSIAFINDQDDFIDELDEWEVDSAFVQFIGFAPSLESQFWNEKDRKMGDRITIDGDCYMEGFFEEYDVSKPIYIVYALRRNKYSYSGNTFSESGINSSDLIDYSSGVGASDAHRLHDQGNYSRTVDTYEYSPFYLGWSDGKATMLSVSEGDEAAIQFFRYVIDEDSLLRQERERATRDVGVFVKGNDQISSVDPSLLHRIQAFVGFTNEKKEIINYYTDSVSLIPDVKVNIYVRTDVSYDSEGWPVEMGKVVLVNDFQEKKEYQLKGYDYIEKIEIVGQSNDMTLQFINGKNNKIVHEEKTISLNGTKIYTTSDPKGQEDKYYQEWLNTKLDGLIIKILYKDKIIFEGKINP